MWRETIARDSCDLPSQWIFSQRKRRLSKTEADVADLKENVDFFVQKPSLLQMDADEIRRINRAEFVPDEKLELLKKIMVEKIYSRECSC